MKKILFLIIVLFAFSEANAQNSATEVLSFSNNCANPPDSGGVLIKTKLPFTGQRYMPTIVLEGYNYGSGQSIGLMINYYPYNYGSGEFFITKRISSHGGYAPETYLLNDNGFVSIFLRKGSISQYCLSFRVRAWLRANNDAGSDSSWFTGWTASTISGPPVATNNYVKIDYENKVGSLDIVQLKQGSNTVFHTGLTSQNLYEGVNSGNKTSTGNYNVGLGTNTLSSITSGYGNVAASYAALQKNTTGIGNVSLGYNAMPNNSTGSYNIGLGTNTLNYNTTGIHNVGIGYLSLQNNITGGYNIAIGPNSLRSATASSANIALGNAAGLDILSGSYNVLAGQYAGRGYKNMSGNVVLGYAAGQKTNDLDTLNNSSNSVLLGYAAGYNDANSIRSISSSVMVGYNAGRTFSSIASNITGSTGLGFQALHGNKFGFTYGIALGYDAGKNIAANLTNVTLIGRDAGNGLTASNVMLLGGSGAYKQDILVGSVEDKGNYALQVTGEQINTGILNIDDANNDAFIRYRHGFTQRWLNGMSGAAPLGRDYLIKEESSGKTFRFTDDGDLNIENGGLFTSGNVGIGTTSPTYKLQVNGGIGLGTNLVSSGLNFGSDLTVIQHSNTAYAATIHNGGGNGLGLNIQSGSGTAATIPLRVANSNGNELMKINGKGQLGLGISTIPEDYLLAVNGKAIFEKVKVKNSNVWPDYVFEENYQLPNLNEVAEFIKINKHLPLIPSANEIEENGQDLGEINRLLVQKVEELTLYLIEMSQKLEDYDQKFKQLLK